MDDIIKGLRVMREVTKKVEDCEAEATLTGLAARRLEECRAFLTRFTDGSGAPEGETFEGWARELLK